MSDRRLYALTDREASEIKDLYIESGLNEALDREEEELVLDEADRLFTPATVDDLGDDAIERMARGLSEHWRDMHTNEALGQQRMLARAALDALLGGGQA